MAAALGTGRGRHFRYVTVRAGSGERSGQRRRSEMPVTVGPYGQSQPSCFDRVKMGFMMGFAVGMAAGALFGTFSCLRIGMRGRELMGGVGKTMMQSGGTFGTFMAIGMGIRC
ncbi:reactive oxygen species modulator 1 isoform X1 [Columba livia]|uniref:reactive oxygen species modulator 1 isoform X1 n=1 Tax=Columba livia TaxID=8932 RepID=UPI0031BB52BE